MRSLVAAVLLYHADGSKERIVVNPADDSNRFPYLVS